jgi:hypothetical protein
MERIVAGLFNLRAQADAALRDLHANGFTEDQLGIIVPDPEGQSFEDSIAADPALKPSMVSEDAVAGGILGGALGAFLAATGALVIPGIGPFISGGILVTLIGGGAGWLIGGLSGLGISEEDARYYQEQVESGRSLVTVKTADRVEDAVRILLRHGGEVDRLGGIGLPTDERKTASSVAGNAPSATSPA